MFFLARSALCIGVVAAMLPDATPVTGRAVPSKAVRTASSAAASWPQSQPVGQRGGSDQAGRFDLAKLAGSLVARDGLSMTRDNIARDAAVRFGLHAMLEHATSN